MAKLTPVDYRALNESFLVPNWPLPKSVKCVVTNRLGGVISAPYDSFNLAEHVNDQPQSVAQNRAKLQKMIEPAAVQWLTQIHSNRVVTAPQSVISAPEADACFTRAEGTACAVLTADCLPILISDRAGTCVAAVHAGWRGLANGVIGKCIEQMPVAASDCTAFIGPSICQSHYEVGLEVIVALYESAINSDAITAVSKAVKPSPKPMHFLLNLADLASSQLQTLGVSEVYGGDLCTYGDERFYSYRRSSETGRQACLIWIAPH